MKTRYLKLDPMDQSVTEIESDDDFAHLYKVMRCEMIELVKLHMLGKMTLCWCDEEGRINGKGEAEGGMLLKSYPEPLAGVVLIESKNMTVDQAMEEVRVWIPAQDWVYSLR